MNKLVRQTRDILRTSRIRREVAETSGRNGFDAMIAELGSFTTAQFSQARARKDGVIPIVIPAHNEGGPNSDLPATLLSLARSEAYPIVVNNRSTDNTTSIARRMGAVVIDAPEGRKMAATQAGIRYVRESLGTDLVLFTDADTLIPPLWAGSMAVL